MIRSGDSPARLTFPRSARLLQPAQFSAVFAARGVLKGRYFSVHRLTHRSAGNPVGTARLGLVVPKRLCRRAVYRNLAKRVVREVFRHERARLPADCDLVVRLAANLDRTPLAGLRAQLANDIRGLLARCRPSVTR